MIFFLYISINFRLTKNLGKLIPDMWNAKTTILTLVFVTSPVIVIGREQSTNLSGHSVILQQETLTGGRSKRSCQGKVNTTQRRSGKEREERMGGGQQVPVGTVWGGIEKGPCGT